MIDFTEPEFIEPDPSDPVDPLDRNWPAPPEPDGPGWWFNPEEALSDAIEAGVREGTQDRWWL
jgi:hypothetical protein